MISIGRTKGDMSYSFLIAAIFSTQVYSLTCPFVPIQANL